MDRSGGTDGGTGDRRDGGDFQHREHGSVASAALSAFRAALRGGGSEQGWPNSAWRRRTISSSAAMCEGVGSDPAYQEMAAYDSARRELDGTRIARSGWWRAGHGIILPDASSAAPVWADISARMKTMPRGDRVVVLSYPAVATKIWRRSSIVGQDDSHWIGARQWSSASCRAWFDFPQGADLWRPMALTRREVIAAGGDDGAGEGIRLRKRPCIGN